MPLRPSSMIRVGATSKSPTPALAGAGSPATRAAASAAGPIFLVNANIRQFLDFAPDWSHRLVLRRNGLFSVNHDRKVGARGARMGH